MAEMKKTAAVVVLVVAAVVWGWQLRPGRGVSEADVRDTSGVAVEVVTSRSTPTGIEVVCRLNNRTERHATHVVLDVTVVDAEGNLLGRNPLAGVQDLSPATIREVAVLVPSSGAASKGSAMVKASLVRWRN